MPRRILNGIVVSDKAHKTVIVRVERRVMHPVYKKVIRLSWAIGSWPRISPLNTQTLTPHTP